MSVLTLDDVLSCRDLPSLPRVAMDVLELTRDPDAQISEIARVIQCDQALTGKVLRTVNSSFYRLTKPCPSIERATTYLGLNAVKSLVLGFSLVDVTHKGGEGLDLIDYWRRCIYSAAAAREIATRTMTCDPEEAFIAALMQDVGMLTIHTAAGSVYRDVVGQAGGDHRQLPRCEARAFGFTHADAGAGIGERWNLPAQIIEPIRLHHRGETKGDVKYPDLARTVGMSLRMATVLAYDSGESELRSVYRMGDRFFGLSVEAVKSLLENASQRAQSLSSLLEVKIGTHVTTSQILADAEKARVEHHAQVRRELERIARSNELTDAGKTAAAPPALRVMRRTGRFDTALEVSLHQARTTRGCLGVIIFQPDRLDAIGAAGGPEVVVTLLTKVAERVERALGGAVTVHELEGDRFGVICSGANRSQTVIVAEAIRSRIASNRFELTTLTPTPAPIRLRASFGVAALEPASESLFGRREIIHRAAERALEEAREAGGDTVRAFAPRKANKAA